MRFCRSTSDYRLGVANRGKNRGVLVFQQRNCSRDLFQFTEIDMDMVVHQAQKRSRDLTNQYVVTGFPDGLMEGNVGAGTTGKIIGIKSGIHRSKSLFQADQIGFGRPLGSPFCGLPFEQDVYKRQLMLSGISFSFSVVKCVLTLR